MKGAEMITPVWALTIDKLCERKDDLLMSIDDIKELARNEHNEAIEKCLSILYKNAGKFISTSLYSKVYAEIAEEMKK